MKTLLTSTLALACIFLISCGKTEKIDVALEEEKIRNVFQTWIKEVSEKESSDAYFKFVTDDFIMSEPNSEPISNRDSLKSSVNKFINTVLIKNTFSIQNWKSNEIIIRDDIAIHRHSGTIILKSKTDTTKYEQNIKYLDILKKNEQGEWKVYLHSYMPSKSN